MANQRSLDKVSTSEKGQPGGVCPLGKDGKIPSKYVDWLNSAGGVALDQNGYIPSNYIRQGVGSGLNAEYLNGQGASDFAPAATTIAVNYPLQGGGDLRSGRVVIGLAEDILNEKLDHTKLANVGSNTHAQLDTFVGLATATPTAGAIPLADSSGSLDAWVTSIGGGEDFFGLDINGDLVPLENPTTSPNFELDSNSDIQPKV